MSFAKAIDVDILDALQLLPDQSKTSNEGTQPTSAQDSTILSRSLDRSRVHAAFRANVP